ncbi:hypothetical protein ACIOWK_28285, partial [Pseudomonas protegens]
KLNLNQNHDGLPLTPDGALGRPLLHHFLGHDPALSSRWRDIAIKRMRTGRVEDWSARLLGLPLEGLRA